jgi:hypothetical protein
MNDRVENDISNSRSDATAPIVDVEFQPLMDTCSSLIRRCLQYQPRTVPPKPELPDASSDPTPWCLASNENDSEEHRQLQQEWLGEMTRIQLESLYLQRRSSLLQPPPADSEEEDASTQILRSYGREIRDAQVAAVHNSQKILDAYEKQIAAVEEQMRHVTAMNRRLWASAATPEKDATADPHAVQENRLLHGIILDLLPYVMSLEDDGVALSRLQRYL